MSSVGRHEDSHINGCGLTFMVGAISKQVSWTDGGAARHVLQSRLCIILREEETSVNTGWVTSAQTYSKRFCLRCFALNTQLPNIWTLAWSGASFSPLHCSPDQRTCLRRSPLHSQTSVWPHLTLRLEPTPRLFFCWEVWIKNTRQIYLLTIKHVYTSAVSVKSCPFKFLPCTEIKWAGKASCWIIFQASCTNYTHLKILAWLFAKIWTSFSALGAIFEAILPHRGFWESTSTRVNIWKRSVRRRPLSPPEKQDPLPDVTTQNWVVGLSGGRAAPSPVNMTFYFWNKDRNLSERVDTSLQLAEYLRWWPPLWAPLSPEPRRRWRRRSLPQYPTWIRKRLPLWTGCPCIWNIEHRFVSPSSSLLWSNYKIRLKQINK